MIVETKRKIHFSEYIPKKGRQKDTDAPSVVTVSRVHKNIRFPNRTLIKLGMEAKFVSFYYEATKKIIGWVICDNLSEKQLALKKYRLVKPNAKSHQWTTSVAGIIEAFNGRLTKDTYKCEVNKYVEQEGVIEKGTIYYYVQLNDDYDKDKNK